jgi:hypothetical protein
MTGTRTGKLAVTRADGRPQEPPYSFVMIEGRATLSRDLDEVRRWSAVIGGRYMGAERAEESGPRNGVPGELLVRLRMTEVIAQSDVSS